MTGTWNPSDLTAHIALSNTNHTATSGSGSGNEGVRGDNSHSTGKWYLEYSNISFPFGGGFGFAAASDTLGTDGQCDLTSGSGFIKVGGSSYGPIGNPNGTVVGFAIDLTNNLLWVREGTGSWNGSGTADPATGVGGLSLSGITTPVFPAAWLQFNPVTIDINTGDTAFANGPPTGFDPWSQIPNVWASTEAADTFSASGYPGAFGKVGDWLSTEAKDTFAAAGYQPVVAGMLASERPDIFSAYGSIPMSAVMAAHEAADRMTAAGIGYGEDGTWLSTEAPDVFAGTGYPRVNGSFITSENADRFLALGAGVTRVRRRRSLIIT